ncbi:phosphoglycerate mutase [Philodulcilactobacillus myokoensis]|uniref:Phosphoglycerate mutase n=1 Tax=Philodulcilactobacillus myokoensis TaxID=2929573 RepID=A0A9W6B190_9LACO|nr:phosphoglycerate mutase [Philodulcilactobacillus myokoensis]
MKIYFVRHGKTKWNLESKYQGASGDSPLLNESYIEMNELAQYFYNVHFAHIYASPIKRARITASRIRTRLNHRPPLTLLSRLKEFNLGQMEGMKFSEVESKFPNIFKNFRSHPDLYDGRSIGGENFSDVINRMTPAIKKIASIYQKDDNVMIVSHGAALNAEINSLLNVPLAQLRKRGGLANTSTTILSTDDFGKHFQLVKWNDTSYLSKKPSATDVI